MDPVKLLGGLLSNNATGGNLLGSLLGGGRSQSSGGGSLVGSLLKGAMGGGNSGGSLLGGLLGGGAAAGGAGLLSGLLGGGSAKQAPESSGGVGGMLGGLLGGGQKPATPPPSAEDQATLLIRAMCNAAKSDGQIDASEQQAIVGRLGNEVDQAEAKFLQRELSSPLDVQGFCQSVPASMAADVYAMSLMAIKVDTREEVAYLQQLGQGLGLDAQTTQSIHKQFGLA